MYKTKDFYLAVTFMTLGYFLRDVEAVPNQKYVMFVFEDENEELPALADEFWAGNLTVNPLDFMHNNKELKSRLHFALERVKNGT